MITKSLYRFLYIAVCAAIIIGAESMHAAEVPDWVVFPDEKWETITPQEAGLDVGKWNAWLAKQKPAGAEVLGQNLDRGFGVVIVRGGYLLKTFGDPDFKINSSSVGKAFTSMVLQLAIDEGLIKSANDPVRKYWTGEGQLTHDYKRMDRGHHRSLTFLHLHNMQGGFPISNGFHWARKSDVPEWAKWTGDAEADNYAHAKPGTVGRYSSGGFWRFGQALTAVWNKSLKEVLDEKLFGQMGIKPDDWQWTLGKELHDNREWYPAIPGYCLFCDPPHEINGKPVNGGPGWLVMSASDLARVGLLVATRGVWKGKRLISDTPLLAGHGGGTTSDMRGWSHSMFAWGRVTTAGIATGFEGAAIGPVKKKKKADDGGSGE